MLGMVGQELLRIRAFGFVAHECNENVVVRLIARKADYIKWLPGDFDRGAHRAVVVRSIQPFDEES